MKYSLIILPFAKQDIKAAAFWYNGKQNNLGKKFIDAVKKEASIIQKNPFLYEVRYDTIRIALIDTFPYLIHFSIDANTIVIKAVFHTSRNAAIWNERD